MTFRLTKKDKQVIDDFTSKRPGQSKKLISTGKELHGLWWGGNNLALWTGKKITLPDVGTRSAQTVQRAVKRSAPAFDLTATSRPKRRNPPRKPATNRKRKNPVTAITNPKALRGRKPSKTHIYRGHKITPLKSGKWSIRAYCKHFDTLAEAKTFLRGHAKGCKK